MRSADELRESDAKIIYRREILQGLWDLRRVLPARSLETLKEDERPRIFPPGEQRHGEVQKVRPLLPPLPGLRHFRF